MVRHEGWQKLDDCQWRHDGVSVNNLLNIYVDDGTRENHASNTTGKKYKITYRNANGEVGEKTVKTLTDNISTLQEAKRLAGNIQKQNPNSLPNDF